MLNINLIRENPEVVEEGVRKKGYDAGLVDKVLEADMARRELIVKVDDSRKERNEVAGAEQRTKDIKIGSVAALLTLFPNERYSHIPRRGGAKSVYTKKHPVRSA